MVLLVNHVTAFEKERLVRDAKVWMTGAGVLCAFFLAGLVML